MASSCPACGGASNIAVPIESGIFVCDDCNARVAYGEICPRIVVEPSQFPNGAPMLSVRIQDQVTKVPVFDLKMDPQHAFMLAKAIISLVQA